MWNFTNNGLEWSVIIMYPLIFVILDDDRAFLEMLTDFVQTSSYRNKIRLKTFTQKSAFYSFIESVNLFHLLVIKTDMYSDLALPSPPTPLVLLGEDNAVVSDEIDSICLVKYQPLNQLLDRMLALYEENETKVIHRTYASEIISVYSAVGGCGKTTVAANLAKLLAFLDHKVFYLNLELFQSVSMFPASDNSSNYAQLLYYLQVNSTQLSAKLSTLKHFDPQTKVTYLDPLTNVIDMELMSGDTVKCLLETIIAEGEYEFIIIDLDHTMHDRVLRALSLSDFVFWIMLDDLNCLHKSELMLKELKNKFSAASLHWKDNISYILNKYTGKIANNFSNRNIVLSGQLPYVPQWKSVQAVEQLMSENAFHGHLLHWFYNIKEKSK
jgi:cellulose biosynthesis protein BcsQ